MFRAARGIQIANAGLTWTAVASGSHAGVTSGGTRSAILWAGEAIFSGQYVTGAVSAGVYTFTYAGTGTQSGA